MVARAVRGGRGRLVAGRVQIRMRDLARQADAGGTVLPPLYWRYASTWAALGVPAFVSVLVIFYLMVAKPA